jgi:1-acyl-sn-glycerol-3-phosphate acyltransferase
MSSAIDQPPAFERRRDVRFLKALLDGLMRGYHRRVIHPGRTCPVPATGPAIVAANHTSHLDPMVLQSSCDRPITWVMTADFFDLPVLKQFLTRYKMIRIKQGDNDAGVWRQALRELADGRVVGVFPEGRIETSREFLPFMAGVAMLAVRGKADLYPAFLDGVNRRTSVLPAYFQPFQRPSIAWSEPLRISQGGRRRKLDDVNAELLAAIEDLRDDYPAADRRGVSMLETSP